MKKERLYKTHTTLARTLWLSYPAGKGRIILRTEQDWEKELEAVAVSEDGNTSTFQVQTDQPFLYFKTCLVRDGEFHWSVGSDKLLLMGDKA